jgi:alpha-galactosidase
MGWNTWNTFGGNIDEGLVRESAQAMADLGLRASGYQYVVIDDLWEADVRDGEGRLAPHPEKFPGGIKALADFVHGLDMKFGIYSCAGTHTCAKRVASYGKEDIDARTFAEWGVDFLKYDYCHHPIGTYGPDCYFRMGQALRNSGREILFSACEWGIHEPWLWAPSAGCSMWRTTGDIVDSWESIKSILIQQWDISHFGGPGRWNDPDMLVVGLHGVGNAGIGGGCTFEEYKTHFAAWCLLCAPLMLGCDVRSMDQETLRLVTHPGLLAISQDPLGIPARRHRDRVMAWDWDEFQVCSKPLSDGSLAVGLFNLGEKEALMSFAWETLGLAPHWRRRVIDVWTGEVLCPSSDWAFSAEVPGHGCRVLRLVQED